MMICMVIINHNSQLTFVMILRKDRKLLKVCLVTKSSNSDDNGKGDNHTSSMIKHVAARLPMLDVATRSSVIILLG